MKPRFAFFLFAPAGVPIYAHATLPLGLALASGFSFRPQFCAGLLAVILVHEAGHALLLHRQRLPVLGIVLHGFGGECQTVSWLSPWQQAVVAWGGVLAQFLLLLLLTTGASVGLWPSAFLRSDFYATVTATNFLIAILNLLPLGGLDGRRAWPIFWLLFQRARHGWLARRKRSRTPRTFKRR